MTAIAELLDPYALRARLQPALLTIVPAVLLVFVVFPSAWEPTRSAMALLASFGGAFFLSNAVRDLGKKIEPAIYARWGGKPSVAMLRHRDRRLLPEQKRRYHQRLGQLMVRPLPTMAEEASAPERADGSYEAASAWLIARSRDSVKYRVLFAENMSYGFRRNLYAAKWTALSIAAACGVTVTALWAGGSPLISDNAAFLTSSLLALYIAGMTFVVTPSWVRIAAEAYALRLLEVIDTLSVDDASRGIS